MKKTLAPVSDHRHRPEQRDRPRLGRRCHPRRPTEPEGRRVLGHRHVNQTEPLLGTTVKIKAAGEAGRARSGGHPPAPLPGPEALEDHRPRDPPPPASSPSRTGHQRPRTPLSRGQAGRRQPRCRASESAEGHRLRLARPPSIHPATASTSRGATSANMNGVDFPAVDPVLHRPPGAGTSGSIDYNLNRDCKHLQATFGLDDTLAGAIPAATTLSTDATARYSGSFALTQSHVVSDVPTSSGSRSPRPAPATAWPLSGRRRCSAASDHHRMGARAAAAHESVRRGRPQ